MECGEADIRRPEQECTRFSWLQSTSMILMRPFLSAYPPFPRIQLTEIFGRLSTCMAVGQPYRTQGNLCGARQFSLVIFK